jgi:hypothetical protein
MEAYFFYLRLMLEKFFGYLGIWFQMRWADPWGPVPGEFGDYGSAFDTYYQGFGFWGWFFYVLFAFLFLALLAAVAFLLGWLIKKYAKFYKTEIDKNKLVNEVETLQVELYNSTQEKNRILGLQVSSLGLKPLEGGVTGATGETPANGETPPEDTNIRFARMIAVDKKYESLNAHIELAPENANISLQDICKKFRLFCCSQLGLYYTPETMMALFASMGTGKIIILEGISGTGKTSLPYALGRFFQNPAVICSVQPSWRDRSELLGYYNDFTHRFTETEFLRAIYEATYREDPNIIVLDEMNLARIEYYFAEFLSIMEMPNVSEWNIDLVAAPQADDPRHLTDGKLLIPQNIWFVGTANNDDSTFTITDKVYDRAMSIFFENRGIAFDAEFTESMAMPVSYLEKLFAEAQNNYPISQKTLDKFDELDDFVIEKFKLAFGNRILKQLKYFVPCYVACGGTELEGVDYIFATKILKKFEVLNIAFLKDELNELDAKFTKLYGKNEFKKSRAKIALLQKMNG